MTATVLVHGGTATGRCWRELVPLLDGPTYAVDLPGRGSRTADHRVVSLKGNAQDVLSQLADAGVPRAHFVGHSLGGATLLAIADRAPERVASLTFLAAPVPEHGGTVFAAVGEAAQAFIGRHRAAGEETLPAPVLGQGALGPEPAVPEAMAPFYDPVPTRAAGHVEAVHYIRTGEDTALAPALQDRAIAHLRTYADVTVHHLAADHMPMLTQPHRLAKLLRVIEGLPG